MDAAATTTPPLRTARSAAGISAPTGAKMIAASSSSGGRSSELPVQAAPSSRANACASSSPARREGVHLPALVSCDLSDDVGGGAEAVDPEPLALAGHAQRAIADQPGAQQRRRLVVGVVPWIGKQ